MLPGTFSLVSIKQVLFCKEEGVVFETVHKISGGGFPKRAHLAELRFLGGGGGVELKGVTSFFHVGPETLKDTTLLWVNYCHYHIILLIEL